MYLPKEQLFSIALGLSRQQPLGSCVQGSSPRGFGGGGGIGRLGARMQERDAKGLEPTSHCEVQILAPSQPFRKMGVEWGGFPQRAVLSLGRGSVKDPALSTYHSGRWTVGDGMGRVKTSCSRSPAIAKSPAARLSDTSLSIPSAYQEPCACPFFFGASFSLERDNSGFVNYGFGLARKSKREPRRKDKYTETNTNV